jgi:hypothetical protein
MHSTKKKPGTATRISYDDGLDFEVTAFEEARRVLDGESTPTPHVAAPTPVVPPEEWKRVRREPLPTDRALSGQAIDWLLSLPPYVRPQHLTAQFPRIVHSLATVWDEPDQCRAELRKLVIGDRKGRRGFPLPVRQELVALRDWTKAF